MFLGDCHKLLCLLDQRSASVTSQQRAPPLPACAGLPVDLVKKMEFAMDVARGMSCLHAQRPAIIHRDLKTAK